MFFLPSLSGFICFQVASLRKWDCKRTDLRLSPVSLVGSALEKERTSTLSSCASCVRVRSLHALVVYLCALFMH